MRKTLKKVEGSVKHKATRRQFLVSIGVVLSLFVSWTLLAYSGALDPLFKQKGKRSSTISIQSFNSNSPSKEYIYAGGRLVATEEPMTGGCTPPAAPVLTTSVVSSVITLNWTVPAGVESFDVERSLAISGQFSTMASNLSAATTSWQDPIGFFPVNPDGSSSVQTYIYRVNARIGQCTTPSNLDWGTNISYFEPLTAQQTIVKARHITELRVGVNAVWKAANQTPATISWSEPSGGGPAGLECCSIKRMHIDELRTKLNQAMDAIQPAYSTGHPYGENLNQFSTPVRALHLIELRDRIK